MSGASGAGPAAPAGAPLTAAPLHVGVTEAGTLWSGTIKSAVGIGTLLAEGIGDTLRVSLTGDPSKRCGTPGNPTASACARATRSHRVPTCGRTEVDIVRLANEEAATRRRPRLAERPITVAVMGCRVTAPKRRNTPTSASPPAQGRHIFAHGERVATAPESSLVKALFERIDQAIR